MCANKCHVYLTLCNAKVSIQRFTSYFLWSKVRVLPFILLVNGMKKNPNIFSVNTEYIQWEGTTLFSIMSPFREYINASTLSDVMGDRSKSRTRLMYQEFQTLPRVIQYYCHISHNHINKSRFCPWPCRMQSKAWFPFNTRRKIWQKPQKHQSRSACISV